MRRRHGFWGLLLLSVLASCSTGPMSERRVEETKRIGVISLVGDYFFGDYRSDAENSNESFDKNVAEWGVDSQIEKEIVKRLVERGTYQSVVAVADGRRFADFSTGNIDTDGLLEQAKKQGLDTVVIARRSENDRKQHMRGGYGYYQQGPDRCVYMLYSVQAMDVSAKALLAENPALQDKKKPCFLNRTKVAWKSSFGAYSEAERESIKKEMYELVPGSIDFALRGTNLLPPKPEPQAKFDSDGGF